MQSTSGNSVIPIKTLSTLQAFILIFKCRFAMGIVVIPYQYIKIGIVPAAILSICFELYTFYSIQNQVRVKQELGDKLGYKFMSYTYAMKSVAAPKLLARCVWISHEILLVTQNVMICCCFTFLITVIASLLVKGTDVYYRLFGIILILPAVLFFQIRTYRTLSHFVAVAIMLSIISIAIVLYDIIVVECPKSNLKDVQSLLFNDYKAIPIFIASFVFTISPISILDAVESFMKNPKRLRGWNGILSITIGINLITLLLVGILSAFVFRDKILFNVLEHYIVEDISSRFIMVFLFISVFITTALHFNVVFGIIWLHFFEGVFVINQELESEAALRALLTLIMYILAICWNHLNAFIPMVGAFCAIPLTLVYPYALEFMVVWPEREMYSKWRLTKILVCFTFAFGLCMTTVVFTVLHCYDVFTHKK